MVVGFNHNVMYKGEIFHIQTEDSGVKAPHIITLVYRGGTIVSSKKTSYADIIKMENLEQVVEELMKEQHKEMLRRLKGGEFDERAFPSRPLADARQAAERQPAPAGAPPNPSLSLSPPSKSPPEVASPKQSLDEIILDYLVVGDDK
jgi:hypothetical protein